MHICVLHVPEFQVEVQLDSQKHKQKGAVKRALFLDSQQPLLQRSLAVRRGENVCKHTKLYLRVSYTNPTMVILSLDQGFCSISAASHAEPEPDLGFCHSRMRKNSGINCPPSM